jgi:hypothetical protein
MVAVSGMGPGSCQGGRAGAGRRAGVGVLGAGAG